MTPIRHITRSLLCMAATAAITCVLGVQDAAAQNQESDLEKNARLARRGAGLRFGAWKVQGLTEVSGAEYSETPSFEGYFQKGLDRHLALESTVGMWRRSQTVTSSGGLGGGSTTESITSYIVPMFTSLKLYPLTGPVNRFEPYVLGGVGFAIGIDDRQTSSGSILGGGAAGTALLAGFGFKGGLGADWRFSRAFGLTAGGRYQWVRFSQDVGGEPIFKGFGGDVGITYRFQF